MPTCGSLLALLLLLAVITLDVQTLALRLSGDIKLLKPSYLLPPSSKNYESLYDTIAPLDILQRPSLKPSTTYTSIASSVVNPDLPTCLVLLRSFG
ncbi:hypothetical protein TrST_g1339 [Triparma strigata]|uniref:Uncharacterized protein n=1 Tax=Triparma strigata TaxID=1606541 RepID=A0A9W7BZG4_9STRA|nr:hypothetical protein TrST_g1339 [Triparma strigata]